MSKVNVAGCLALAAVIAFLGGVAEQFTGPAYGALPGAALLAVLVLSYPAVRRHYGERQRITFKRWVLASSVASVAATAIYVALKGLKVV